MRDVSVQKSTGVKIDRISVRVRTRESVAGRHDRSRGSSMMPGIGRSEVGGWFPPAGPPAPSSAISAANLDRPREMRDRTVPGGMFNISPISSYSRSETSRRINGTLNSSGILERAAPRASRHSKDTRASWALGSIGSAVRRASSTSNIERRRRRRRNSSRAAFVAMR